jgi:hypothetical protein
VIAGRPATTLVHPLDGHPSRNLFWATGARSRRASSWDRTGANRDCVQVGPGQTVTLLETTGAGCITHIYMVLGFNELTDYRDAIVRCYWDGEPTPSVEVPLGDFFAVTHGRVRTFRSQMVAVNPGDGCAHGMNSYFPMPFTDGAVVTVEHRGPAPLGGAIPGLWYHIDYETYDAPLPEPVLRFHAQWRQERPTDPVGPQPNVQLHGAVNLTGAENYVALEAEGEGQMAGLVLEIDNPHGGWFGEGDDMVFIDGDTWPPSIHGTGTEEIFGAAASPTEESAGPYIGYHLIESPDYSGLTGMYRWFVPDPIRFTRSIRWTVEHGHANNFGIDYSSVAYWYQREPHAPFPSLPGRAELLPPLRPPYSEARDVLMAAARQAVARVRVEPQFFDCVAAVARLFYRGEFASFLAAARAQGFE